MRRHAVDALGTVPTRGRCFSCETCRKKCCTADVRWDGSWRADVKHTQLSVRQSVCVCLCVQWWRDQLWVEQLIPALPLCEDNPHSSISWWMVKKKGFSLAHIWFSFMTARHWNTFMWMLCVRYTYLISLQQWGPLRAQCSQWVLFNGKNRLTNLTEKKWQLN